jgi:sulfatase modifying factor 1
MWILVPTCLLATTAVAQQPDEGMVLVPTGDYLPFVTSPSPDGGQATRAAIRVSAFWMDRTPVTETQFLAFARNSPAWRRSRVSRLFTDQHYLETWKDDLHLPVGSSEKDPVTEVSWFGARAYCHSQGKELPTNDQWELAALDRGRSRDRVRERILAWYGRPNASRLQPVGTTAEPNGYGISDLFGLIWEWTLDFNGVRADSDSRFCGGAAAGVADKNDYASFMRFSFRNSLKASYATKNLGFRCVRGAP